MADQGHWFKLWCSAASDPDLAALSLEDFARWVKLGMFIKQHGDRGTLKFKKGAFVLQQTFRVSCDDDVLEVLKRFPNCDLKIGDGAITVTFSNWHKYQVDSSAERMRKMRDGVTAKKRREEKRREENNREPKGSLPALPKNGSARKKIVADFKQEDFWIKTFLETQTLVTFRVAELEVLLDPEWWERVATACHGIEPDFVGVEFAKMGNWLARNKNRRPSRQFIQNWLVRAGEASL